MPSSSRPPLPFGGGEAIVRVETTAAPGVVAPRARVELAVDAGTLAPTVVTTDATGHAEVSWSGDRSATLTARAGDLQTSAFIRVRVPQTIPPMPPPELPPPAVDWVVAAGRCTPV